MLIAVDKFSALELCDRGEYGAAAEMAGLRVGQWPENVSQSNSEHAMALLLSGVITSTVGGIQQAGGQAVAREMLAESIRLFGDDPRSDTARYWMAWSDYWEGNLAASLLLIEQITASAEAFRASLLRARIYLEQGFPGKAFTELESVVLLYGSCDCLHKGNFHLDRGRVLRALGETDRAVIEYDSATHFFEQAGNVRSQASAVNNLSNIYLETEQFTQAHEYADEAQRLFQQLGDRTYEAKAWDQIALIYLSEGKLDAAEAAIVSAVSLVEHGEILRECEATAEKIKNRRVIESANDYATLRAESPHLPNLVPSERSIAMTPLEIASFLIENPEHATRLLDLLIWATSVRDDPQHEAELDEIEEMLYSKTEDGVRHRVSYRASRLLRDITASSNS